MLKSVELLGLEITVEYDEEETYTYAVDDGEEYEAATTTDGRLIAWDDAVNSWIQVSRWAEE